VIRPKLLAADLDGTLLEVAGGPVEPAIVAALRHATAAGVTLCICTGRPTEMAHAAAHLLGVTHGYAITFGGAETSTLAGEATMLAGAESLERLALAPATHERVLALARDHGLAVSVHDSRDGPVRDVLTGAVRDVDLAVAELRETAGQSVAMLRPSGGVVAVQDAAATKERALRRLAARLGIGRGGIAYLGDADDDAPALAWAGLGVAVAAGYGAPSEAETAADLVVQRADVAETLARLASAARPGETSPAP
jgi:HAD superfamily hydrolase (TIGR01484 family)